MWGALDDGKMLGNTLEFCWGICRTGVMIDVFYLRQVVFLSVAFLEQDEQSHKIADGWYSVGFSRILNASDLAVTCLVGFRMRYLMAHPTW